MTTSTVSTRTRTAVDAIADEYASALVKAAPYMATAAGLTDDHTGHDDYTPEAAAASHELRKATLAKLDAAQPQDLDDYVTIDVMRDRLGIEEEMYAAQHYAYNLNVLSCPLQGVRQVYDLMPQGSNDDWAVIAQRMAGVGPVLEGYHRSLLEGVKLGRVPALRQVEGCIEQIDDLLSDTGYFASLPEIAQKEAGTLNPSVQADLAAAIDAAREAYRQARQRLVADVAPHAPQADAVGRERYQLASRHFVGATVDMEETYAWGQEELERILTQMRSVAEQIKPGASIREAYEVLNADLTYQLHGTAELKSWMQGKADEAVEMLAGTHFEVEQRARTIECCIAPTNTGGMYYTPPAADWSRPGRMWWSVPHGVTEFTTWQELTTVYHEGVPGHHLDFSTQLARAGQVNTWRSVINWISGYGEGWALYAERLMSEFGYLDDPGMTMGWLDGQCLRAARVVVDIGVHCGFEAPASVGGGAWTYDKAWEFLRAVVATDDASLRFELARYLGWAGQAPSYKIGERLWLQLREEYKAQQGEHFALRDFHSKALRMGSVDLGTLRKIVLDQYPVA